MEKTLNIEGMKCNHCKAAVEKALLAVDGVTEVLVSLEEKNAKVQLSKEVSDQALTDAVTAKKFQVTAIL